MQKKRFALFLILILCITLCSCTYSSLSDPDTLFTVPETVYEDGIYTAHSKYYNPYGYGEQLYMEVKRGIITHVSYKEVDKNGNERTASSNNVSWNVRSVSQIYATLYADFIENQNASVNVVSGATETSNDFKLLASILTKNATDGTSTDTIVNNFTWTYTALNPVDTETGITDRLTVSFEGDTITQINYDTINSEGEKITSNNDKQAFGILIKTSLEKQTLAPVLSESATPAILARYNTLLKNITDQRSVFQPQ